MNVIGKWKVKKLAKSDPETMSIIYISPDDLEKYFGGTDEYEEMMLYASAIFMFNEDGTLKMLIPLTDDIAEGEDTEVIDGYAVAETSTWKEEDGKIYYDAGMEECDVMGEPQSSYIEIEQDGDDLIYNLGMLIIEKIK